MSPHSPLPWSLDDRPADVRCNILGDDGACVASCEDGHYADDGDWIRGGEVEGNAELILRCVNGHAELVAAALALLDYTEGGPISAFGRERCERLRAALAAA